MYENFNYSKLMDDAREMLEEVGITDFVKLSKKQKEALDMFQKGRNVLIIGCGGTGKSKLINEIKYHATKNDAVKNDDLIAITATTGISAYNINGCTFHSFFGIGTGEQDVNVLIKRVKRNPIICDRIRRLKTLVVDEISMMSADLFEKLNFICQTIRKNYELFGNIQVVFTGDFLQLLPVFKNPSVYHASQKNKEQDTRLIFESSVFTKYFNKDNIIILQENFRQIDKRFQDILNRIRIGQLGKDDLGELQNRLVTTLHSNKMKHELESAVYLVTSNKKAQTINSDNLNAIKNDKKCYTPIFQESGNKEICKDLTKELQYQFTQKGLMEVTLKKDARVMLLKNIDIANGLVNGSIGTVVDFIKGYPLVKFDNGVLQSIDPVLWEIEIDDSVSKASQIPLMLCWAITIHKCQSLTLEKAIMDLSDCFCEHQVYVALSRVKSLDGLFLKSFNPKKICVNKKVVQYLSQYQKDLFDTMSDTCL